MATKSYGNSDGGNSTLGIEEMFLDSGICLSEIILVSFFFSLFFKKGRSIHLVLSGRCDEKNQGLLLERGVETSSL